MIRKNYYLLPLFISLTACATTGNVSPNIAQPINTADIKQEKQKVASPLIDNDDDARVSTSPISIRLASTEASKDLSFNQSAFNRLNDWDSVNFAAARESFSNSCKILSRYTDTSYLSSKISYTGRAINWKNICARVNNSNISDRDFWEQNFTPWQVKSGSAPIGKLTSYFEPIINASFNKDSTYNEPLYGKPSDLLQIDLSQFDPSLIGKKITGRINGSEFIPYRTRSEITESNAPVLAYAKMGEALSLQIQGSGRLLMNDGKQYRALFSATNGRNFASVAKELINRGQLSSGTASADNITEWFEKTDPQTARDVINANPRTVFFKLKPIKDPRKGPIGAQGVPLVAQASLAVDPNYYAYSVPIFLNANSPALSNSNAQSFAKLVIAQDTGGAIKGPIRGDLFYGTGKDAGLNAGRISHQTTWWVLLPNGVNPNNE